MSNGESDKTGPDESSDVGQSGTSGRATVPSNAVDTSGPIDDCSSLHESLVYPGRNRSEIWQPGTSRISEESLSTSISSAAAPSPTFRFNLSLILKFPSQVSDTDDDDIHHDDDHTLHNDKQTFPYVRFQGGSHFRHLYALLISGRDVANVNFERTCQNDVFNMQNILGGPNGTIPNNNIHRITPNENNNEREIEGIYFHITTNRPKRLVFYYSGHSLSTRTDYREINVSAVQGNALAILRVKAFIESLMPDCAELWVILDCCSAGEHKNLLLPLLPADFMPERRHIQWFSCMQGGTSYMIDSRHSEFTYYIISALTNTPECPNRDANCPLCSKFRRSISQKGRLTWEDLMEYVFEHMMHSCCDLSPSDRPIVMMNPVSRDVR